MAYGRVDVYWPNGEFNSFLLDEDSVSIGRSSGCTITLETDTISRYHVSIRRDGENTYINDMDSANGTHIDGVRLKADESKQLFGGEEIQIGQLRMIYLADDDQLTVLMGEVDVDTQRFEREDHMFRVDVTTPDSGIPPGSHKSVLINITNTGVDEQVYTVSVTGLPHGWGRVNRPSLRVPPDETVEVLLNVKPPRRSDTRPGEYPVTIIVAHDDDADKKIEAYALVEILPYSAFAMALVTRKVTAYDRLTLALFNQGSAPLPLHISATSADNALKFAIPSPQIVLAPGERTEVKAEISPRRRHIAGQTRDYPFDVQVRSRDEAHFLAAMRGKYTAEPVLPRWAVYAISGMSLSIVALLVVAVVLIAQIGGTTPQINGFESDVTQIASGERVNLRWQAENAESYSVRVNGADVFADLPPETTEVALDTSPYTNQTINVELIAHRGSREDSVALNVEVVPGLTLITFEVIPPTLVRNVITSMTISWNVEGGLETRVEGVGAIRRAADVPVEVAPSYGPEANFDVQGYATDDFILTLIGRGRLDIERAWTLNIDVIDAICSPVEADYQLLAAPNAAANVVRTYGDPAVELIVDRIDPTKEWIRVRMTGGQTAWGPREGLSCAATFNPDNLLIEVVPTPAPTATPTAIPTPEPTIEPATPAEADVEDAP